MKHFIGYGVMILLVGFLAFTLFQERGAKEAVQTKVSDNKIVLDAAAALLKTYKDSTGATHSQFKPNPAIPRGVLTGDDAVISKPLLDSILNIVNKNGIKPKQLEAWYQLAVTSQAKALKAEVKVDSLKRVIAYTYKSKYLDMTFTPPVLGDTINTGTFGYRYNNLLDITQYSERKRVLGLKIGAKESFVDVAQQDTNALVNGLKSIIIKTDAPRFEISTPSLLIYNPRAKQFNAGQAVSIRYGKLSAIGAYSYDFTLKKSVPYFGIGINWLK